MVGQAYFGRTCTTELDVVRHSSNIECPKESFSVDGFEIFESEVSADTANNVNNVPDGIRKHALFRRGNIEVVGQKFMLKAIPKEEAQKKDRSRNQEKGVQFRIEAAFIANILFN